MPRTLPEPDLQTLPQPVGELGLAELRQIVDTLFAKIDATDLEVLGRCAADALDYDRGVGLEDDAVVNNLVNGKRNEVVVFDNGALVNRLPKEMEVSIVWYAAGLDARASLHAT